MVKRIFPLVLIMLLCLSSYFMVFADSNVENDNDTTTLTAQDDQATAETNTEETREFKTSRRYSLQIGIVLLILMVLYKAYKFIKYKKANK